MAPQSSNIAKSENSAKKKKDTLETTATTLQDAEDLLSWQDTHIFRPPKSGSHRSHPVQQVASPGSTSNTKAAAEPDAMANNASNNPSVASTPVAFTANPSSDLTSNPKSYPPLPPSSFTPTSTSGTTIPMDVMLNNQKEYLEAAVFPALLPAIESLLRTVKKLDTNLESTLDTINPTLWLAGYLKNNNPKKKVDPELESMESTEAPPPAPPVPTSS